MEVGREEGRVVGKKAVQRDKTRNPIFRGVENEDFAVSLNPYLLNDADFKPSVAYHVDAVVHLPRSEQDGPCWHKLGLHVLAELNEEWLLKVTKGSILRDEIMI